MLLQGRKPMKLQWMLTTNLHRLREMEIETQVACSIVESFQQREVSAFHAIKIVGCNF